MSGLADHTLNARCIPVKKPMATVAAARKTTLGTLYTFCRLHMRTPKLHGVVSNPVRQHLFHKQRVFRKAYASTAAMPRAIAALRVGRITSFLVLLYTKNKPRNVAACALNTHQNGNLSIK
jgi:hypothetical protein